MLPTPYAKLQSLKQQVARLETGLARQRRKLVALPGKLGFSSVEALIAALRAAANAQSACAARRRVRRHSRITPEIKAKVKAPLE